MPPPASIVAVALRAMSQQQGLSTTPSGIGFEVATARAAHSRQGHSTRASGRPGPTGGASSFLLVLALAAPSARGGGRAQDMRYVMAAPLSCSGPL